MLECKLEYVGERCGCLPWFIQNLQKINVPNIPVCNIFGNKCYEQYMFSASSKLSFKTLMKGKYDINELLIKVLELIKNDEIPL